MSTNSFPNKNFPKDNRLALRLTENQKVLIEDAADLTGRTLSDFSLAAILAEAERTITDRIHFRLPASQWEHFLSLLDAPVEPNPGLAELKARKSVFND